MKLLSALWLSLVLTVVPFLGASAAEPININTADVAGLQQLTGIGQKKAEAIIQYRDKNGPFASVDDLAKVSGIGEKTVEKNRSLMTVGSEKPAAAANPADAPAKPADAPAK